MIKLCDVAPGALEKLAPEVNDRSGIGVHYVDAFIKPMNTKLEDGTRVTCKRKGLKITLKFGDRQGSGLMRRVDVGPDPELMLRASLAEAAVEAGVTLTVSDSAIFVSA